MDKSSLARLAFWAMNMMFGTGGRNNWPGFSYSEPEWTRLTKLADTVEAGAYARYRVICAAVFIVLAAVAVVGLFVPIMTALYPDPADTKALPFVLLLAATALLAIGIGLPLSMRFAAWASVNEAMRAHGRRAGRRGARGQGGASDHSDDYCHVRNTGAGDAAVDRLRHPWRPDRHGAQLAGGRLDGGVGRAHRHAAKGVK